MNVDGLELEVEASLMESILVEIWFNYSTTISRTSL